MSTRPVKQETVEVRRGSSTPPLLETLFSGTNLLEVNTRMDLGARKGLTQKSSGCHSYSYALVFFLYIPVLIYIHIYIFV